MAPPPELRPFTVAKADFLYKTANEDEWIRLQSPVDDLEHNCNGITFDRGVLITQKHHEQGSTCRVKFILKPPLIRPEDDQVTIEATCVKIHNPGFIAHDDCKEKAKALEHAKTLPLARLGKRITAVKLRNLSEARAGAKILRDIELSERIWGVIDLGYRDICSGQRNASRPKKLWTPPPQPSSGSAQTNASQPVKLWTPPRRPASGSVESFADKRTLGERLQEHRLASEEGERKLRQALDVDRQAIIQTVTVAINGEWERQVEAQVAGYGVQRASIMEKIVAEEGG